MGVERVAERDCAFPLRSAVVALRRSDCSSAQRRETAVIDAGVPPPLSATIALAMAHPSRRTFLQTSAAFSLAAISSRSFSQAKGQRVFVGSNKPDGILAFDWNPETAEFTPAGIAARLANVDWIAYSADRKFLFAASEVDTFNGKPTGGVASHTVVNGTLHPLSSQNSAISRSFFIGQ